ncbi:MAG: FkbM family methyltransferase [Chitinispirillia bacterium]|nr:FkbM family methyltransferase [Chitinispirillia bacterium]
MSESQSQILSEFLSETEPLIEQVDKLPMETAAELYDMCGIAAQSATANIHEIDPEIRVKLCDIQDKILERIIDLNPSIAPPSKSCAIYTPAVQGYRRWSNVELMKDKGLVGYTLAKEIGAHPVMYFGTKPSDYPYLSVLPEMEVLYDGSAGGMDVYYKHLNEHYSDLDVLILHGMYEQTIDYLDAYRKLRPDGKVFCGLDMNRHWMGRINWDDERCKRFAEQCDLIATSCRSLRDALNRNREVHFSCRWFPNGFFNPTGIKVVADSEQKENIILTVGRIGTAQKNNAELLVAFANASRSLSGWSVRLIGAIEPDFQPFIDDYFTQRPDLKNRVIFTGPISDKNELYTEYKRAKVFILTSQLEGGTPNVYAEALFHGCKMITSDIDAADDITNFGELGIQYKLGDIDALSSAFVKVCSNSYSRAFEKHIPKALDYGAKYFDWNRNAKKLAYMLFNTGEQSASSDVLDNHSSISPVEIDISKSPVSSVKMEEKHPSALPVKMSMQIFLTHLNSFESICHFVEQYTPDMILEIVSHATSNDIGALASNPMGGYSRVMNDDGSFSKGSGSYIFVLRDLKQHLNEYKYVYSRLADNISREVFTNQMRFRIFPAPDYLRAAHALSARYSQYFAEDIFKFGKDEVFVDCGGYIGDTAEEFIKRCKSYKRIYVYEPLAQNVKKCHDNLANYENLIIRQAGVGRNSAKMELSGSGGSGSFAATNSKIENDDNIFEVVSLDEDINEQVTFIKMDVECFELEAISGVIRHIKEDSPKLAICLYHMVSDLWEIPKLIHEINPNYKYYMRHYHLDQNWEYVLYAVPNDYQLPAEPEKIGRNDSCSCGSGRKYKKCCGAALL